MANQTIKNTTRGQVILHNLRMISQVLQKVTLVAVVRRGFSGHRLVLPINR
ncbi:MAG: hypothetical protein JSR33_10715 [Proteobacteria bacterium]|nr:hypothetical protein [Pseudomonadota bacterium]